MLKRKVKQRFLHKLTLLYTKYQRIYHKLYHKTIFAPILQKLFYHSKKKRKVVFKYRKRRFNAYKFKKKRVRGGVRKYFTFKLKKFKSKVFSLLLKRKLNIKKRVMTVKIKASSRNSFPFSTKRKRISTRVKKYVTIKTRPKPLTNRIVSPKKKKIKKFKNK